MPKIRIHFKTPDAVNYALIDHGLMSSEDRYEGRYEGTAEDAEAVISKFVRYGELCTIEIDTETQTATVVPMK